MTEDFRETGYESAKSKFAVEYARVFGLGSVAIIGFIVYKFISALDEETLIMFATVFFAIVLALFALGASLVIVTVFRYIQKPGVQLPGKLGSYERRLGLD